MEQRSEDAPHLLQLVRRSEERLVAQRRVQEHPLVRISHVGVAEVVVVRHVHDCRLRDKSESGHFGRGGHVERLVRLDAHDQLVGR
eukprot:5975764-Prymnesium_polylepis.1